MSNLMKNKLFLLSFAGVLVLAAMVILLTTCDIGLGNRVNTDRPVIGMPDDGEHAPGSFLKGNNNEITLDVQQPFGLDSVYMTIFYFCNDENCEQCPLGFEHTLTVDAVQNPETGLWVANIDTTGMADGKIRAQVTAIDAGGNETTTTDIIYIVKNMPPQVELTIPNIKGENFDKHDLQEWLVGDPVILGFSIMGLATDNLGIKLGYPKIQIWPASLSFPYVDYDTGLPRKTGVPEYDRYTEFYSMVVPENTRDGVTSTRFSWPMWQMVLKDKNNPNSGYVLPTTPDDTRSLNPGQYRFRIEIRDTDNIPNYYPNRYDNPYYTPDENPIKYMEISYIAADIPIIMLQEPKQYYNGVGNYEVDLIINSQNVVTDVYAWVTDRDENPSYTSDKYPITWVRTDGNRYIYKLTLNPEQAADWHTRPNTNIPQLFLNFEAIDERDNKSPTLYRSFLFDVTPPSVQFDRPFSNLPQLDGGHGVMEGGVYDILYPNNPPRWINGTATVSGSSLDATSGISKLYYHIGKLNDDQLNHDQRIGVYEDTEWIDTHLDSFNPADHAKNWSGNVYTWQYTELFSGTTGGYNKTQHSHLIQEMSDLNSLGTHGSASFATAGLNRFYLPFYVKIVDGAGNFRIVHYKICVDPDLDVPYITINTPAPTIEVPVPIIGGEVRLSGTASDDDWVHSVIVRIKKEGSNTWYIPTTSPPTLEVYSGNSGFPTFADDPGPKMIFNSVTERWDEGPTETTDEAKAGWFRANKIGDDMVVGWFANINGDGKLDPDCTNPSLHTGVDCPYCPEFVHVFIEVRAVDTKSQNAANTPDVVGPSSVLPVIFSAGAPRISNPKIKAAGVSDRDYYEGINGSGIFTIQSTISDDKGITNVRVKLNGIDHALISNGRVIANNVNANNYGISITEPAANPANDGRIESTLTIAIDTKTNSFYIGNFGYGKTGYLDIDINVQDNNDSPMFARGIYKVGVDNYYPTTTIETQFNASSVRRDEDLGISGNKFELSGIAKDYGETSGSIQEMARVLVFFQEAEIQYSGNVGNIVAKTGGAFMNQRGKKVGETDQFYNKTNHASWLTIPPLTTYPNVRTSDQANIGAGVWGTSIDWFPLLEQKQNPDPNIGFVWESPHALVIDNAESDAWLDLDGDGTYGEVWSGLVDKTWRAFIDTEYFSDGPLMVHYIVMDQAGNATRYQRGIYVENNKPQIVNVNFGTDFRGAGSTAGWTSPENSGDFMRDNYSVGITTAGNRIINFEPQFRIRGSRLSMRLETRYGNNAMNYEVSYVTPLPRIPAANMTRGEVYTIETPGTTDWQKYGSLNNSRQTTFVASGPGAGTGFVVPYTKVRTVNGAFAANGATTNTTSGITTINNLTVFNGTAHFETTGAGSRIKDSYKENGVITRRAVNQRGNWPSDWERDWPEQLFIVKVYDTTVTTSGAQVQDQLAHAILVALDVDNTDTLAPSVTIAPFGKKYLDNENEALKTTTVNVGSYEENIVMSGVGTNAKKEGYVQYAEHRADGAADAPDLSGQVIFLGKSSDNQRIQNINVTIGGFNGGNMFTVANYNPTTGKLVSVRETMGTGNNAWYFKITSDHLTLNYGHTVNWEFAWDTSEVSFTTGGVAYRQVGNQDVIVTVNDYRPATPAPSVASNTLRVRIVPYISEIVTGLSSAYKPQPSAFARSSTGWYSVRENETITVRGFNLGTNEATAANAITGVRINTTDLTYSYNANPDTALTAGNFRVINKNEVRVNVGATATSGELSVRVGANLANANSRTSSFNNSTRKLLPGQTVDAAGGINRVPYNWEPNGTNNNNLTNDRKLYIWSVGSLYTHTATMINPFFRMDQNGARFISFGHSAGGNSNLYVRVNETSTNNVETEVNRFVNTTVSVDSSTNTAGSNAANWYIASSNITASGTTYNFNLVARTASASSNTSGNGQYKRILSKMYGNNTAAPGTNNNATDADRFKIPRISVRRTATANATAASNANPDRIYVSYADTIAADKPIVFHYGTRGVNTSTTWGGNLGTSNTAGGSVRQIVASDSLTYKGSIYSAVGSLSTGVPVIAWYDAEGNRLVFSWGRQPGALAYDTAFTNSSTDSTTSATNNYFQSNAVVIQNGVGSHVDLVVDSDDNVHLAYYDSGNGGLYYAFIPHNNGTTSNTNGTRVPNPGTNNANVQVVKVDTFLAAGTKLMLNVRNGIPYISYYHGSFSETKNAIRVAYRRESSTTNIPAGSDENDFLTGNWEVMTVPVENTPLADSFICNGVPTARTAWVNVGSGTLNNTYISSGTYLANTILVGYLTSDYRLYEGAVLKLP